MEIFIAWLLLRMARKNGSISEKDYNDIMNTAAGCGLIAFVVLVLIILVAIFSPTK